QLLGPTHSSPAGTVVTVGTVLTAGTVTSAAAAISAAAVGATAVGAAVISGSGSTMRRCAVSYDVAGSGRLAGRPRERLHWRSPLCLVDRPPTTSRGHPMTSVRTSRPRVAQGFLPALAILVAGCAPQAVTSQGREI